MTEIAACDDTDASSYSSDGSDRRDTPQTDRCKEVTLIPGIFIEDRATGTAQIIDPSFDVALPLEGTSGSSSSEDNDGEMPHVVAPPSQLTGSINASEHLQIHVTLQSSAGMPDDGASQDVATIAAAVSSMVIDDNEKSAATMNEASLSQPYEPVRKNLAISESGGMMVLATEEETQEIGTNTTKPTDLLLPAEGQGPSDVAPMVVEDDEENIAGAASQSQSLLDMEHLFTILEGSEVAGHFLADQDVLLFVGGTGVGKATSILYLAGVEFKMRILKRFFHDEPTNLQKRASKALRWIPEGDPRPGPWVLRRPCSVTARMLCLWTHSWIIRLARH
jgi:hypothetical protein